MGEGHWQREKYVTEVEVWKNNWKSFTKTEIWSRLRRKCTARWKKALRCTSGGKRFYKTDKEKLKVIHPQVREEVIRFHHCKYPIYPKPSMLMKMFDEDLVVLCQKAHKEQFSNIHQQQTVSFSAFGENLFWPRSQTMSTQQIPLPNSLLAQLWTPPGQAGSACVQSQPDPKHYRVTD